MLIVKNSNYHIYYTLTNYIHYLQTSKSSNWNSWPMLCTVNSFDCIEACTRSVSLGMGLKFCPFIVSKSPIDTCDSFVSKHDKQNTVHWSTVVKRLTQYHLGESVVGAIPHALSVPHFVTIGNIKVHGLWNNSSCDISFRMIIKKPHCFIFGGKHQQCISTVPQLGRTNVSQKS